MLRTELEQFREVARKSREADFDSIRDFEK